MNRWLIGALAFLVLIFAGKWIAVSFFGPSDENLIREAVTRSIEASREGRPGGVIDYISDRFAVNGDQPGTSAIARFIRESKPEVTIDSYKPLVNGDQALITTPVKVRIDSIGIRETIPNVTFHFMKESSMTWLIIPTHKWRLTSIELPASWTPPGLPFGG